MTGFTFGPTRSDLMFCFVIDSLPSGLTGPRELVPKFFTRKSRPTMAANQWFR